jgi:hypothetical protein
MQWRLRTKDGSAIDRYQDLAVIAEHLFLVCRSVVVVMAAIGFALTASHLEKRQVTRCKSETISGRYRRNGYVHHQKIFA